MSDVPVPRFMTVGDLIEALRHFDPALYVSVEYDSSPYGLVKPPRLIVDYLYDNEGGVEDLALTEQVQLWAR